ncbi:hypothetical protein SCHPADRAFT_911446, partial [Schizopora paradoxa]
MTRTTRTTWSTSHHSCSRSRYFSHPRPARAPISKASSQNSTARSHTPTVHIERGRARPYVLQARWTLLGPSIPVSPPFRLPFRCPAVPSIIVVKCEDGMYRTRAISAGSHAFAASSSRRRKLYARHTRSSPSRAQRRSFEATPRADGIYRELASRPISLLRAPSISVGSAGARRASSVVLLRLHSRPLPAHERPMKRKAQTGRIKSG